MRHTALAAALMLSFPALAQDAPPRVLFCSGPCFAVDASGTRTPAPKGTQLTPGQRLETGPGAYVQVKLGSAGLGVAENSRVRFEPGAITLDQGRLRAVTGTSTVRPISTLPPIRTPDGVLAMKGGDIEIKKTGQPGTLVKVNAGDPIVRGSAGELPIPKDGVQNLLAGKPSPAPAVLNKELVLVRITPESRPGAKPPAGTPAPLPLPPVANAPRAPMVPGKPILPILRQPDLLPNVPITTLNGESKRLSELLRAPTELTTRLPTEPTTISTKQPTATFTPQTTTTRPTITFNPRTRITR